MIFKTEELFDSGHSIADGFIFNFKYPHQVLPHVSKFIKECSTLLDDSYKEIADGVFVSNDAKIWDGATILGPTVIGHEAVIRPGAFIRGSVIIGNGTVIGNSTEVKNSIIFDEAQLPHYNYVGDSIIGYRAHMGAGAIASNLRLDKRNILLKSDDEEIDSGLRKIGVFLGDYAEVGCGCVLCPGSIVGREAMVYPLVTVRGTIPDRMIYDGKSIKNKR